MKILRLLLLVSVVANVVGVIALSQRSRSSPAADAAPPSAEGPALPPEAADEPHHWQDVAALDEASYVALLRQEGWSPKMLRAIVGARVDLDFVSRWEALARENPNRYWTGGTGPMFFVQASIDARMKQRQLSREHYERTLALLGEDAMPAGIKNGQNNRYGPIAEEKIKPLQAIETDYRELIEQARNAAQGVMLDEDRELIRMLEAERDADIAALLTPEEKEAFELRTSPTAMQLRFRLDGFDPSEEEYVTIFHLQKTIDDRFTARDASPEERAQRQTAQEEVNRQIAAALGEERYRDYEIATHSSWRQTQMWTEQQKLDASFTKPLAALALDFDKRRNALSRDSSLSREDRAAKQQALYLEASLRLGQILPPQQIESYQKGPGRWLQSLQPRQR